MAISVDWLTQVISVPQADLVNLGGGRYEFDVNQFRLDLKALEDDEIGMNFLRTHNHNTAVVLSGVTYARTLQIINGYTVTFTPDTTWTAVCVGANHNIGDVKNVNSVSIEIGNSAGLVELSPANLAAVAATVRTAMLNTRIDNITYDPSTGSLTAARKRYFPDSATANASTSGGTGEGEDLGVTITADPGASPGQIITQLEVEE